VGLTVVNALESLVDLIPEKEIPLFLVSQRRFASKFSVQRPGNCVGVERRIELVDVRMK